MKRLSVLVLVYLAFTTWSLGQAEKKRIAVMDFEFAGIQQWWGGYEWDIGKGIADIIVKDLVRDGSFRIIERRALDKLLAEQNFSNSERADPTSAARIGKMLGVDAIVVGSITQFGTENKKKGISGLGGGWGGWGGGTVGKTEGKAQVAIDARLVDVDTGEILAVADGKAESKRSGLLLGGSGGGSGGFGGGQIDMSSSNFQETILGEATHAAAEEVASDLIAARNSVPTKQVAIRALVAYAEGGLIILNAGSSQGVSPGMELNVERVRQTIKDPATGKVLRELTDVVARIKVTKVDEGSAEASLVSGTDVKVGDVVKN